MKKIFPPLLLGAVLVYVLATMLPPQASSAFDLAAFRKLPVLADGRIKPLDTVARTHLLVLQGRQRLVTPDGRTLSPEAWLLDVFFQPQRADMYATVRIDNPDVLSLFNLTTADGVGGVRFSFAQLSPFLSELERQAQMADPVESAVRSAFQRAVVELRDHLQSYSRLKYAVQAADDGAFPPDLDNPAQLKSARAVFETMATFSSLRLVPPPLDDHVRDWQTVGSSLLQSVDSGRVDPHVRSLAALGQAWRAQQPEAFNATIRAYAAGLAQPLGAAVRKCSVETLFNRAQPFYTSMLLYVLAFLCAVVSWLKWPELLVRLTLMVMSVAFVLTTVGVGVRMWLEGRPPVTNLYSSALFIGWGAVGLCLILERLHRNGMAGAAGALLGFGTLIIAHHLSLSGDTLEMMRAVLDSNFWLSTHVVTVTVGYASTFLAGFLAILYILRGTLTRSLDRRTADSLARMVYGIICFATFFSFVGTVLGGIWADQSWGRFWGWDPKENGALIIVVWNAVILHCRWGGLVRQRGLMALAVFGNVVTAWSWFGTNMLGIGLHSYGFTTSAFYGLLAFVIVQLLLILLVLLPFERWNRLPVIAAVPA